MSRSQAASVLLAGRVDIGGVRLHHVDGGQGQPLLFIHGITATHRYWWQNLLHFAKHRRVIALDLPGYGRSDKPDADYSIPFFVEHVAAFLKQKKISQVDLVGNSLGGLVSMMFAIEHPERVRNLVLVDPAGVTRFPQRLFSAALVGMGGAASLVPSKLRRPPRVPRVFIARLFAMVFPERPDLAEKYVRSYERAMLTDEYPLLFRAAFRTAQGIMAHKLNAHLPRLKQRTLINWGARDYLLPVSAAPRLRAQLPTSELLIYTRSGHCPMVDEAERWNADVEAFLDGKRVGH
jgi:4,5:9,10-diseco-3-hydroxy-5,9,17-trioxoandrosta-1(10),2-diene-4-oate hydrolase